MPLRPRQNNTAVNHMYDALIKEGWTEEEVTADIEQMSEADRVRAFQKSWKENYEQTTGGDTSGKAGATIAAFGESFAFKLPRVAAAAAGAVTGLVTDLDPVEGARKGWQGHEDRLTYHEITNPETYTLANLAGYVSPGGIASSVFKGATKAAQAAGLGTKATVAAASGSVGLAQTSIERPIEGEASLGQAAMDVGLGLAAPMIGEKVGRAFMSGGRTLRDAGATGLAKTARVYSKLLGKSSDLTDELLAKAPETAKVIKEGIQLTKSKLAQSSDELLQNVNGYLQHLKASVGLPEGELGQTAASLKKTFIQELDGIGRAISEQANSAKGVAKVKIKESFDAVKGLAVMGRVAVKEQYGAKIRPLEKLGENLRLNLDDAINAFADPLIDAGLLVNRSGTVGNHALRKPIQEALAGIFSKKKTPLNFAQVNKLKMGIGEVVDWDAQDPLNVGLKNLYTNLRGTLTEAAKDMPTDINADKLFSEYMGASQLASKFQNAFYGKAADGSVSEVLPSSTTLKQLINLGKGFSELTPVNKETQNHLSRMVRMSVRETKLQRFADPTDVSSKLKSLVTNNFFDENTFVRKVESITGKIKDRQKVFEIAEGWNIPKEAKSAIKAGGATFKDFIDNLPPTLQASREGLQQLHNKYHKALRLNGYKANEVFEILKTKQAVSPQVIQDLQEVGALIPEFEKLVSSENILKLAQSSEAKLKILPSKMKAVGLGLPTYLIGGPQVAFAVGFLERVHGLLTQPAALKIAALKYKWVPSARVDQWVQDVSLVATKVLPALRGGTAGVAQEAIRQNAQKEP